MSRLQAARDIEQHAALLNREARSQKRVALLSFASVITIAGAALIGGHEALQQVATTVSVVGAPVGGVFAFVSQSTRDRATELMRRARRLRDDVD